MVNYVSARSRDFSLVSADSFIVIHTYEEKKQSKTAKRVLFFKPGLFRLQTDMIVLDYTSNWLYSSFGVYVQHFFRIN